MGQTYPSSSNKNGPNTVELPPGHVKRSPETAGVTLEPNGIEGIEMGARDPLFWVVCFLDLTLTHVAPTPNHLPPVISLDFHGYDVDEMQYTKIMYSCIRCITTNTWIIKKNLGQILVILTGSFPIFLQFLQENSVRARQLGSDCFLPNSFQCVVYESIYRRRCIVRNWRLYTANHKAINWLLKL
jgi:hypothetical protein